MLPHGTDSIAAAVSAALDLDGFIDGGEVIIPNYTFIATASAPLSLRCHVCFVDVDRHSFTLDAAALQAAIQPGKTKAILPVHLGGHPADMDQILEIANHNGLKVIEDCAQAHGAEWRGRKVGSFGNAGAFSFQSSKNITSGEGGCVVTHEERVHEQVQSFMNVGRVPGGARWHYQRMGWNYRPSEYLAALLTVRLRSYPEALKRRSDNAKYLSERLSQVEGITPPAEARGVSTHAYHLYIMKVDMACFGGRPREDLLRALEAEGVPCSPGYTQPLSEEAGLRYVHDHYSRLLRIEPCPNVRKICATSLWLFQHLLLGSQEDMDDIAEAFLKVQRCFRG
jgi:dTDP-4-amino-4,6-dideoxygalactose transaminase